MAVNPKDEARYQAARQQVAASPDDLAILRNFAVAAKAVDRRFEAVEALQSSYKRRPTPELYGELRSICTFPEFQSIKPPAESAAGPGKQAGTGADLLPRKPFPLLLDQVILYPVQDGLSVFILICCALLVGAGNFMIQQAGFVGYAAAVILLGIAFGYFWSVMAASGMGEKRTRGWPDFTDPSEFGSAVGQYFMVTLVCFGPALVVFFYSIVQHHEDPRMSHILGAIALGFLGVLYYPMALMLAGFTHDTWQLFNLPTAIRSIAKIPVDYAICLAFFVGIYVVVVMLEWFLGSVAVKAPLPLWILLMIFIRVIDTYLVIAQMRTAGLLFYAREKDLGWFQ
ncbi:MAG TPA: hypothetical protein VK661_03670 [Planctomycetota bacterium]|nr:hypothetical protein [Planctomycetota bacterium]